MNPLFSPAQFLCEHERAKDNKHSLPAYEYLYEYVLNDKDIFGGRTRLFDAEV